MKIVEFSVLPGEVVVAIREINSADVVCVRDGVEGNAVTSVFNFLEFIARGIENHLVPLVCAE